MGFFLIRSYSPCYTTISIYFLNVLFCTTTIGSTIVTKISVVATSEPLCAFFAYSEKQDKREMMGSEKQTSHRGYIRYFCILFFAIHIPTTLLVDAQAVFPRHHFPAFARTMLDDFIARTGDPLMSEPREPWFLSLIWTEVLFQLPFFVVALYAFVFKKPWIRTPAAAYGGFVCATMVPILNEICITDTIDMVRKVMLLSMYLPYFVVPFLIVIWCCFCGDDVLFGYTASSHGKIKYS